MKTSVKNYLTFFEQIIIDNIDLSAYEIESIGKFEDVQAVYKIFLSEKGYEIKRVGEKQAFSDWLQGLPSVLTVPFYYFEQIELGKAYGILKEDASEKEEDVFIGEWFKNCTQAFYTLKNNL